MQPWEGDKYGYLCAYNVSCSEVPRSLGGTKDPHGTSSGMNLNHSTINGMLQAIWLRHPGNNNNGQDGPALGQGHRQPTGSSKIGTITYLPAGSDQGSYPIGIHCCKLLAQMRY